ncbi:uncharacterized protein LTHEOB_1083 [Neofusicoccum parvum]|uniref:Uncharacterized protein LTHEOB_1083 n=1 Tax=Neofusicoccum parvum TaxID=310453 RepID=A0ACB5SAG3_9PEZI|nr:uncharacterized protein LTHEOB_1083 [Neofusicoccum parvum]
MESTERNHAFTAFGEDDGNKVEILDLTSPDKRPAIETGAPTTTLNNPQPTQALSHNMMRKSSLISPRDDRGPTLATPHTHAAPSPPNNETASTSASTLIPSASPATTSLKRPHPSHALDPRPPAKKQRLPSATASPTAPPRAPLSKRERIRILKHNVAVTEQELAAAQHELAEERRRRAQAERRCRRHGARGAPLMRTAARLLVWVRDMYRAHRESCGGERDQDVEAYMREIRGDVGEDVFGELGRLGRYLRDNVEAEVKGVEGGAEREGVEEGEGAADGLAKGMERLRKLSEQWG